MTIAKVIRETDISNSEVQGRPRNSVRLTEYLHNLLHFHHCGLMSHCTSCHKKQITSTCFVVYLLSGNSKIALLFKESLQQTCLGYDRRIHFLEATNLKYFSFHCFGNHQNGGPVVNQKDSNNYFAEYPENFP